MSNLTDAINQHYIQHGQILDSAQEELGILSQDAFRAVQRYYADGILSEPESKFLSTYQEIPSEDIIQLRMNKGTNAYTNRQIMLLDTKSDQELFDIFKKETLDRRLEDKGVHDTRLFVGMALAKRLDRPETKAFILDQIQKAQMPEGNPKERTPAWIAVDLLAYAKDISPETVSTLLPLAIQGADLRLSGKGYLDAVGTSIVPALLQALNSSDPVQKYGAVRALYYIGVTHPETIRSMLNPLSEIAGNMERVYSKPPQSFEENLPIWIQIAAESAVIDLFSRLQRGSIEDQEFYSVNRQFNRLSSYPRRFQDFLKRSLNFLHEQHQYWGPHMGYALADYRDFLTRASSMDRGPLATYQDAVDQEPNNLSVWLDLCREASKQGEPFISDAMNACSTTIALSHKEQKDNIMWAGNRAWVGDEALLWRGKIHAAQGNLRAANQDLGEYWSVAEGFRGTFSANDWTTYLGAIIPVRGVPYSVNLDLGARLASEPSFKPIPQASLTLDWRLFDLGKNVFLSPYLGGSIELPTDAKTTATALGGLALKIETDALSFNLFGGPQWKAIGTPENKWGFRYGGGADAKITDDLALGLNAYLEGDEAGLALRTSYHFW